MSFLGEEKSPSGKRFPILPAIVLVLGILWLAEDLQVLPVDVPWLPVILVIVAIGWIVNNYK
ncbi:MAG: hypothetical protein ACXQT1_04345 [Methermicoccaceae archaeon]